LSDRRLWSLENLLRRFLSVRSPSEAGPAVVSYLRELWGRGPAFVLYLDPSDGRLRGTCSAGDDEVAWELDPVSTPGVLSSALTSTAPSRPVTLHARALPPPADGARCAVMVPLATGGSETDGAGCARVDCLARSGQPATCGAGSLPRGAWTRDALTCGRLPVVGLVGVAGDPGEPPPTDQDVAMVSAVAHAVAPLYRSFRVAHILGGVDRFRGEILESLDEGIIATSLRGDVLTLNQAAESISGVTRGDAIGRPIGDVLRDETGGRIDVRRARRAPHGRFADQRRIVRPDGTLLPVRLSVTPLAVARHGFRGLLVRVADLSRLVEMEQEIRRLDRLAALGRVAAAVAHEIRNPLAGIAAGVQYLARLLPPDAARAGHVERIDDEITRLDRIVGDLFTVAHPRPPCRQPTQVRGVLERVVENLSTLSAPRRVRLELRGEAPEAAIDADQIQQVFFNLVKNAIEVSPEDERVEIHLRARRDAGSERVVVEVKDRGAGIPFSQLEEIFEPFYTTKDGGTGLGLYVSHGIIERHGGKLRVKTVEGIGTTFAVELPVALSEGVCIS
jgi:PAS domain S-box-containing protein